MRYTFAMIQIRQGKIEDFKKLTVPWAWNPESEWQQEAQKDCIKGIEESTEGKPVFLLFMKYL
jgi:hypothetical protein